MFGTGSAGALRLFGQELGGQIAWLLPFSLLAIVAVAWQKKPRLPLDRQQQSLVLWGVWLLTMGVFFSVAGFFHPYYLTVMAPAVCALFGIGAVVMWRDYRTPGWRGWLLPVALIATIAEQIYILSNYPTWSAWLTPLIAGLGGVAIVVLVVARLFPRIRLNRRTLATAVCSGILVLLLAPTVWAAIPVINNTQAQLPTAGPTTQGTFGGAQSSQSSTNTALINYLEKHQGSAKYLVATTGSQSADEIILATNKAVMAMGGFSGSDPILTTDQLATLAKSGTVRYFLISSGGGMGGQSTLTSWIQKNCKLVPTSDWQSSTSSTSSTPGVGFNPGGSEQLYVYSSAS